MYRETGQNRLGRPTRRRPTSWEIFSIRCELQTRMSCWSRKEKNAKIVLHSDCVEASAWVGHSWLQVVKLTIRSSLPCSAGCRRMLSFNCINTSPTCYHVTCAFFLCGRTCAHVAWRRVDTSTTRVYNRYNFKMSRLTLVPNRKVLYAVNKRWLTCGTVRNIQAILHLP